MKDISITPYGKNVFQDIRMTQTLNEYETPLGEIVACYVYNMSWIIM